MKAMFLGPISADTVATACDGSEAGDKGEAEGFEAVLALVAAQATTPAAPAKLPAAPAPAQLMVCGGADGSELARSEERSAPALPHGFDPGGGVLSTGVTEAVSASAHAVPARQAAVSAAAPLLSPPAAAADEAPERPAVEAPTRDAAETSGAREAQAAPLQTQQQATFQALPAGPATAQGVPAQAAAPSVLAAPAAVASTAGKRAQPALRDESRAAPAPAPRAYAGPNMGTERSARQVQPNRAPGSSGQSPAAASVPGSSASNASAHAATPAGEAAATPEAPAPAVAVQALGARRGAERRASEQLGAEGPGAPAEMRQPGVVVESRDPRVVIRVPHVETTIRPAADPNGSSELPGKASAAADAVQVFEVLGTNMPEPIASDIVEQPADVAVLAPAQNTSARGTPSDGKLLAGVEITARAASSAREPAPAVASELAASFAAGTAPAPRVEASAAAAADLPSTEADVPALATDGTATAATGESEIAEHEATAPRGEQTPNEREPSRDGSGEQASREDAAARFAEQWMRNTAGATDLEVQGARGLEAVVASLLRAGGAGADDSASQATRHGWVPAAQPVQSANAASATATRVKLAEGVSAAPGALERPRRNLEDERTREPALSLALPPVDFAMRRESIEPSTPAPLPAAPTLLDVDALQRAAGQDALGAAISLHHPELGDVELLVQNQNGRIEVRAVLETPHAAQVLRAQESALRYGVQQAGMTMGTLRVRSRTADGEPVKVRENTVRRRRDHEWEA